MECDLKPWEIKNLLDMLDEEARKQKGLFPKGLERLSDLLQEGDGTIHINRV